jgi:hypothetical protein
MNADCTFVFDSTLTKYSHANLKALQDTTYLELAFHGVRAAFNRLLDTKSVIDIVFTERVKELLQKRSGNNPKYPYAYLVVSDIDIDRAQGNNTAIAHSGIYDRGSRIRNSPVTVAYVFPGTVQFTLHVMDNDARRLFLISQSILLADMGRALNFVLRAFGTEYEVIVKKSGSISTPDPMLDTSNDTDPEAGHLSVSFEMHCKLGFATLAKSVDTINVTTNIRIRDEKGQEVVVSAAEIGVTEEQANGR